MPAISKAQRRLMAMALHQPEKLENKSILGMSEEQLREFAETKEKKLPKKKKKKR